MGYVCMCAYAVCRTEVDLLEKHSLFQGFPVFGGERVLYPEELLLGWWLLCAPRLTSSESDCPLQECGQASMDSVLGTLSPALLFSFLAVWQNIF